MKKVDDAIREAGHETRAWLLLQVHDELLFEVDADSVDEVIPLIKQAMEHAVELPVPFVVNASKGARWGKMEVVAND